MRSETMAKKASKKTQDSRYPQAVYVEEKIEGDTKWLEAVSDPSDLAVQHGMVDVAQYKYVGMKRIVNTTTIHDSEPE